MTERIEKLKSDIQFEMTLVDEVIDRLSEVKAKLPIDEGDHTTEPALGTYLMNFYNGIENMIKRVCKLYYNQFPKGDTWHKDLLQLSCHPPEGKEGIFSEDMAKSLNKYLNFRHRFISGYGFQLEAEKMIDLVEGCPKLWIELKGQIANFFKRLNT